MPEDDRYVDNRFQHQQQQDQQAQQGGQAHHGGHGHQHLHGIKRLVRENKTQTDNKDPLDLDICIIVHEMLALPPLKLD